MNNIFKNTNGVFYTQGLFFETAQDKTNIVYTLKDQDMHLEDGTVLPSLKQLYLQEEDTTEYEFANKHLGGWPHWQRLLKIKWFREEYAQEWRTELELKLKARSLRAIRTKAEDSESKESFQANKYLVDKDWVGGNRAGRPTKQSVKDEALKLVKDNDIVDEDHQRILQFKREF